MKKILIIVSYTLYIFIFLGFVFHTSASPVILGKYTVKNIFALILLLIGFIPFIWGTNFLLSTSVIKKNKKKIVLTPLRKIAILLLLSLVLLLPCELYFRNKYSQYGRDKYIYTINNYHPFLQLQLAQSPQLPVNSQGFRGEEIRKEKGSNSFRIVIMGGSTVLNSHVPYEKSITYLLQKKLNSIDTGKRIEVINAGVDGYTSEHSVIQYLFKVKDFSPDMIIMWQGINDWYYSCTPPELTKDSFQSDYSHYLGASSSMVQHNFSPGPVIAFNLVSVDFFLKFLADNLYSDVLSYIKLSYPQPGIYNEINRNNTYSTDNFPSVETYKRNIQTFIDVTKHDNVKLLLGNQAFLYASNMTEEQERVIYFPKKLCSVNGKYPDITSVISSINKINTATKNIANYSEVAFIDLEKQIPKTLEYFTDDVHYTEKGNARISDILFKELSTKIFKY